MEQHRMQNPAVMDAVLKWSDHPDLDPGPESVAGVARCDDGSWDLIVVMFGTSLRGDKVAPKLVVPLVTDHLPTDAEMQFAGRPMWGLRKLAPGVWKPWGPIPFMITMSQAMYVTVVDVPDPAPWETSPLVVT